MDRNPPLHRPGNSRQNRPRSENRRHTRDQRDTRSPPLHNLNQDHAESLSVHHAHGRDLIQRSVESPRCVRRF
ncbi:hypothetical protein FMEAI12_4110032 [Parafrankia sp. Ea1.12]|nr:hypothetical protein FMEAI12_4110032 [Parafrankia sp. Ea1.12]